MVYKPLWGTHLSESGEHLVLYTNLIDRASFDSSGVDLTAHLFQKWVPKDHEVRLTVVDDAYFTVAVAAASPEAKVDWRSDCSALSYYPTKAPEAVRLGVRRMLRRLGLRFSALDFVVTPGGGWVFLEINANGQWGWLENETAMPIAATVAGALAKEHV